jgi:hypothetical protein
MSKSCNVVGGCIFFPLAKASVSKNVHSQEWEFHFWKTHMYLFPAIHTKYHKE